MPSHPELAHAIHQVRGHVRLPRGRGAQAIPALLEALNGPDSVITDPHFAQRLVELLGSMQYAIEDAQAEIRGLRRGSLRR